MKNTLSTFFNTFMNNLNTEIAKNVSLKEKIDKLLKKYSDLQPKTPENPVPQRFWDNKFTYSYFDVDHKKERFSKILEKFPSSLKKFTGCDKLVGIYSDFLRLKQIEQEVIPNTLLSVCNYQIKSDQIKKEAETALKKWRDSQLNNCSLKQKHLVVNEIRNLEIQKIEIKNLNKIITANFEVTSAVYGIANNGKKMKLPRYFNCAMEFIKENNQWKPSNFSYVQF
ncbi:hypothetical protein NUSPORA_01348 [Nucleospora cyclopteri]